MSLSCREQGLQAVGVEWAFNKLPSDFPDGLVVGSRPANAGGGEDDFRRRFSPELERRRHPPPPPAGRRGAAGSLSDGARRGEPTGPEGDRKCC